MRKERLGRTRVTLSAGLLVGGLWAGAAALFTDTATTDAAFTTGTVLIDVTGEDATFFTADDLAPGDVVLEELVVTNAGSLDFTYTMATVPDASPLAAGLQVEIRTVAADCGDWATGTPVHSGANWTNVEIDTPRALASSASENLCFRVELPGAADDSLQGLSTTVAVNFSAENS